MKTLLLFTSSSCVPCAGLKAELQRQNVSERFVTDVIVASFDTQSRFVDNGVRSVPTLICMDGEREVGRITGAQPPAALANQLDAWEAA